MYKKNIIQNFSKRVVLCYGPTLTLAGSLQDCWEDVPEPERDLRCVNEHDDSWPSVNSAIE